VLTDPPGLLAKLNSHQKEKAPFNKNQPETPPD
jgi:hypothetical protein